MKTKPVYLGVETDNLDGRGIRKRILFERQEDAKAWADDPDQPRFMGGQMTRRLQDDELVVEWP